MSEDTYPTISLAVSKTMSEVMMVKCKWMYYMKPVMEVGVKYSELVESGATKKQRQEFLTDGDMAIVTIRIPQNLKDAATEAAGLKGIGFSAFARMCILDSLVSKNNMQ